MGSQATGAVRRRIDVICENVVRCDGGAIGDVDSVNRCQTGLAA